MGNEASVTNKGRGPDSGWTLEPEGSYDEAHYVASPLSGSDTVYDDGNSEIGAGGNETFHIFGNETDLNITSIGDHDGDYSYNFWFLSLVVFSIFAVFGNILVILSVKRERTLWNVTNYFIVSLAVADLLVAGVVMPCGVYFLVTDKRWWLPPVTCDLYIAMDVTCSTASILNLVAISIDRFIAVTQPIKYAKHKSNNRAWLTIVFVWVFSAAVGSPIVLGLNTPIGDGAEVDPTTCVFHNYYFTFVSSLCSFYIPCTILIYLYYRIFKVIRERARAADKPKEGKGATIIENKDQTRRFAETALGSGGPSPVPMNPEEERGTNTGSGSQEDDGDNEDDRENGDDEDGDDDDESQEESPRAEKGCQIIANSRIISTAFVLESVRIEDRPGGIREQNGNNDSGYAASNLDEGHPVPTEPSASPASPRLSIPKLEPCKRNGLKGIESERKSGEGSSASPQPQTPTSTSKAKASTSRFTMYKAHKASRRKKEKSSAKRERKATKTLAIVLGLFLACWLPFFTCNIMDAICQMGGLHENCGFSIHTFLLTTWLGYANSCVNPIIYTIFNPEFRKAFKKILGCPP